jgi:hypothetical protein
MAQGNSSINVFSAGMSGDTDVLNTDPSTYRDSMNGRLMFNKDGTYSWETENGTKTSFTLRPNNGLDTRKYKILGNTGNDNIRIIWSTIEDANPALSNSEIGIFSIDEAGVGQYKTLFNDANDPNQDKFNLLYKNQIEARFVYENPKIIRCYWIDGIKTDSNRPRTFTMSFDENLATPIGNESDVVAYSIDSPSVFAMNSQTDFRMGIMKYVRNVGGGLVSGIYQYSYSLGTKEGYNTPWYPIGRRVVVCNAQVSSTNWHTYQFSSSGITTSKGNQIEIKGIDTRYDRIRISYTLMYTSNTVVHSKIWMQTEITNDIMSFDHVGNVGEPILTEEIAATFSGIVGAKTLNIKDATLYYGNIKENLLPEFDIEPILENLEIQVFCKDMRSDEGNPNGIHQPPITHQDPKFGITQVKQHSAAGGIEDYQINNEYCNYKGTQIDHLYPGYFRAETYRFAIVFFDKLGFESFAFHLGDVKMPNVTGTTWEWQRIKEDGSLTPNVVGNNFVPFWQTNNWNYTGFQSPKVLVGDIGQNYRDGLGTRQTSHLKIMGVKFGGIDISSIKHLISGFKIVRAPRDKSILLQGAIMPTVGTVDNDDGPIVLPLPKTHQNFFDFGQGTAPNQNSQTGPGQVAMIDPGGFWGEGSGTSDDDRLFLRPNISVLYAPALNFGTAGLPGIQSEDQVKIIGCAWDTYSESPPPNENTLQAFRASAASQWYGKHYNTWNDWHKPGYSTNPFPRYESYMEGVVTAKLLDPCGKVENFAPGTLTLVNDVKIRNASSGDKRFAKGAFRSLYMLHGNFIPTSSTGGTNDFSYSPLFKNGNPATSGWPGNTGLSMEFMGHLLFNWVRPNPSPYGGLTLSALEQSIFFGTGHFQPVNNPTFDAQGMPANDIFDDIEVWGGDCFLDYVSMMRMYPHAPDLDDKDDYSDGRIWPWENEYNHTLRFAGSEGGEGTDKMLVWANVMARPIGNLANYPGSAFGVYIGDCDDDNNPTGVFEEFSINGVLNFQEITVFFNPKPVNFLSNDIFPVRWRYTPVKLYGDTIDTWRTMQVNDFRDLNGRYGEITSSLYIFNQIYSWQVSGFGRLRASDRALIESQQGGTLTTGIGDKLDGVDYISTEFGNQHQWSLFASNSAAYWVDVNRRKIMRFAQDGQTPLSDIKGQHSFLEQELPLFEDYDNPVLNRGVHGVFDFGNNEAIFTFNRDRTIYPDTNGNIQILSRSGYGKTYSPYIVGQNQTALVSSTANGQPIFLPIGNVGVGINENTVFYLHTVTTALNTFVTMDVYNTDNSGITLLFTAQVGKYYRLFRHGINDAWMYEEVDANDTTSHKTSLTFNEYGNWYASYHGYAPTHYIGTKFVVVSQDAKGDYGLEENIQIHDMGLKGEFYSWSNKSYFTISVNESPMVAKAFDSLRINCNEDANTYIDTILMLTETQFYFMDMTTDSRKKYLEDVLRVPLRTETQENRMRGKHLSLTVELKNNTTFNARITNLVTYFRPSKRF